MTDDEESMLPKINISGPNDSLILRWSLVRIIIGCDVVISFGFKGCLGGEKLISMKYAVALYMCMW